MIIHNITPADIPEIAEVHLISFPEDHFTARFTKKMLIKYLNILTSFEDYNYLIRDENSRLAGYLIAGTKYHLAVNEYLKKNLTDVVRVLIFSPSFILGKAKTLLLKLFGKVGGVSEEISVNIIAVNPDVGSKGIGSMLLDYLEKQLIGDSIFSYILYVKDNNEQAIAFYKKKSFEIVEKTGTSIKLRKTITEKNITL